MTLKELFKKHNAQHGFKFKSARAFLVYEVLCIGIESVFVKHISGFGEESSFDLDMVGYEKYEPPKKTKKIMVADYYEEHSYHPYNSGRVITFQNVGPVIGLKKIIGSEREITLECDK